VVRALRFECSPSPLTRRLLRGRRGARRRGSTGPVVVHASFRVAEVGSGVRSQSTCLRVTTRAPQPSGSLSGGPSATSRARFAAATSSTLRGTTRVPAGTARPQRFVARRALTTEGVRAAGSASPSRDNAGKSSLGVSIRSVGATHGDSGDRASEVRRKLAGEEQHASSSHLRSPKRSTCREARGPLTTFGASRAIARENQRGVGEQSR